MSSSERSASSRVLCISIGFGAAMLAGPGNAGFEAYIGDIVASGYNFCPRGTLEANGQLLPISQYSALFSLLGTTYGGDGQTNFGLPNLNGRAGIGQGNGPGLSSYAMGSVQGTETKTITVNEMPSHSHAVNANNLDGDKPGPAGKLLAAAPPSGAGSETIYSDQPATRQMANTMISASGGGQPISTRDPYLTMIYCIATEGVYPSRP